MLPFPLWSCASYSASVAVESFYTVKKGRCYLRNALFEHCVKKRRMGADLLENVLIVFQWVSFEILGENLFLLLPCQQK